MKCVCGVTQHVVLKGLEPFVEEQVVGLKGVGKRRIHSLMLASLELSPGYRAVNVVGAAVIISTRSITLVSILSLILEKGFNADRWPITN